MLRLKAGVRINGLRPELMLAIIVAEGVYHEFRKECVITSVTEGKHKRASLHYVGCAVDLRTRHLSNENRIVELIKSKLTDDYDVILESDHIHLEYQPKRSF